MTAARLETARRSLEAAQRAPDPVDDVDLSWLDPEHERDSWTLANDTLRFLASLVALLRPRQVLEFGSGVSTRLLASGCARLVPPATVIALESDPAFAFRTKELLASDAAGGAARVELTHLVSRRWYGRNVPVYDLPAAVVEGSPPQLVLVDGPPLPLGGRHGSLLQAIHLGEPGTVVLLDDADRPSERAAVAMAEELFDDHIEVVPLDGFAKGLVAIVVGREVDGSAMPPASIGADSPAPTQPS